MAGRPPKESIDYAGWDVNIFDNDPKIDVLLDSQGWKGFGIYFYLCQRAYGSNGYFYVWRLPDSASDDGGGPGADWQSLPDSAMTAANIARKMGGGIGSQTVIQTVNLCLQIGLFDNRLFVGDGVMTSRGIQKRFKAAVSRRTDVVVIEEYWLLTDAECEGFNYRTQKKNLCIQKSNYCIQKFNLELPKLNYRSLKESKVFNNNIYINNSEYDTKAEQSSAHSPFEKNETFENEKIEKNTGQEKDVTDPAGNETGKPVATKKNKYGEYGWVKLTDGEYERLNKEFSEAEVAKYITYVDTYVQENNNKQKYKDWNLVVRKAIREKWGKDDEKQSGFNKTRKKSRFNNYDGRQDIDYNALANMDMDIAFAENNARSATGTYE